MWMPLSAAKCMAMAILLDDDTAAAAALADYMVESGVEAFAAERERLKRIFDAAVWDIRWRYGDVSCNDNWIGWFRQRLFAESTRC